MQLQPHSINNFVARLAFSPFSTCLIDGICYPTDGAHLSVMGVPVEDNATYHKHRHPGNHAVKAGIKIEVVSLLVTKQCSPRQISGSLALVGKNISHETINKMIRSDKANGGNLYKNCRHHLRQRRRPVGEARIKIPNRTSIT